MSLVHSRTGSGLIVAEEKGDVGAIARALRQIDDDLLLQPEFSQTFQTTIWKVMRYQGDRPAAFVLAFVNERGEPYPLSSRILDMVRALDRNSRHEHVDEDARNAQAKLVRDKAFQADQEALRDDVLTVARRGHSGVLPRSQSLRRARDKRRARGEKC